MKRVRALVNQPVDGKEVETGQEFLVDDARAAVWERDGRVESATAGTREPDKFMALAREAELVAVHGASHVPIEESEGLKLEERIGQQAAYHIDPRALPDEAAATIGKKARAAKRDHAPATKKSK